MCVSIIHIQTLVHELQSKQFFYKLAYLTLTFDLVTLTLGQLLHLIDINHVCKYHLYLIISQNKFFTKLHMRPWPLTLWPCDLVTLTSHWYQSFVQVSSISNHWFMIYSWNKFFYIIAYLTSTFDLVTLTLGQLQHIIVINYMWKYHKYPVIGSWYIFDSIFCKLAYLTLTFDLVTFTLGQLQHPIYTYHLYKYD